MPSYVRPNGEALSEPRCSTNDQERFLQMASKDRVAIPHQLPSLPLKLATDGLAIG